MHPILISSFAQRALIREQMDDLSLEGAPLHHALRDLRNVNRLLGGYRTLRLGLAPLLTAKRGGHLSILDLGAGAADGAEQMLDWGLRHEIDTRIVAVDANPAVVRFAASELDRRMSSSRRARIEVRHGDALNLPFPDKSFDVVTASLFMHHLSDADGVRLLQTMDRLAAEGILVNDLYRHPIAYVGFRTLATALRLSPVVRHDGAISVRRGFRPQELKSMARAAGLESARVGRRWAFRIYLTTI